MPDKPVIGPGNGIMRERLLSAAAGTLGVPTVLPARVLGRLGAVAAREAEHRRGGFHAGARPCRGLDHETDEVKHPVTVHRVAGGDQRGPLRNPRERSVCWCILTN